MIGTLRLDAELTQERIVEWKLHEDGRNALASESKPNGVEIGFGKILAMKLPMALLGAQEGHTFNLRFVLYRDRLPIDALPQEGSLEIQVAPEDVLAEIAYESQ